MCENFLLACHTIPTYNHSSKLTKTDLIDLFLSNSSVYFPWFYDVCHSLEFEDSVWPPWNVAKYFVKCIKKWTDPLLTRYCTSWFCNHGNRSKDISHTHLTDKKHTIRHGGGGFHSIPFHSAFYRCQSLGPMALRPHYFSRNFNFNVGLILLVFIQNPLSKWISW